MIRLIAAIDNKRGIAKDGKTPWRLPSDIARYKELTLTHGGNILTGRKTHEQMGVLPNRHNYIVSHQDLKLPSNCTLVKDVDSFLNSFQGDLWVVGGEQIYDRTIIKAEELYLTLISQDFNCDQFFPEYNSFKLKREDGPFHENGLSFNYQFLIRF